MSEEEKESNVFESNDEYQLKKISFNKKNSYLGYITVILIVMIYGSIDGKLIIPSKHSNTQFSSYSLYLLFIAGLIFIFHFLIQIIGQNAKNENEKNLYYKYAYNSRVFGVALIIIAIIVNIILNFKLP